MDARDMIIDRPERQSRGQRIGFGVVTFVFWLVWLYLWLPLITALAWYLGFERVQYVFVELEGFEGFKDVMGLYFTILELIVVVFLGWSLYNQNRFGKRDKRRRVRKTNYEKMCRSFGLSSNGLRRLRRSKISRIDYAIGGSVVIIDTLETAPGESMDEEAPPRSQSTDADEDEDETP